VVNPDDLLAAALRYAEMGYRVLPCIPGTKHPITQHGFHDAVTDAAQIERWWARHPRANVGIAAEGMLVVDIDGADNPWPGDAIALALDGRYRLEHLTALSLHFDLWQQYQRAIAQFDAEIAAHLKTMRRRSELPPLPPKPRVRGRKPHDPGFDVRTALYFATGVDLTTIEGIDEIHALTLVSELGSDFTKWPTVKHFTSWLGLCPNFKQTGGQVKSSKTRKGKNRAAHALRLAAWGLMRSTSGLGCYLRRQRGRLGAPKAITATAHKLARIVYHLVRFGGEYIKLTEAAYTEQIRDRLENSLHKRAKELGYKLTRVEMPNELEKIQASN
jgi:hypothetical protein